jgi:RNA polymerase sigma-70 factor (ECF subfamily)
LVEALSDGEAVRRVLGGDPEAFGVLVERYRTEFGRVAGGMLGDRDAADDVLQEAFISAYRSLGSCRDPEKFRTWFYTIVTNRCRDALRKKPAVSIDAVEVAARDTADAGAEDAELAEKLQRAMDKLTPEQREVFVLKEVEGKSYEEMRDLLDMKVDALRMRVMRAKDVLRKALKEMP